MDAPEQVELSRTAREQLESYRVAHETQVLTIFFSDLVESTRLQSEVGNIRAADIVGEHRAIVRRLLASHDGREVDTAGDSFLAVFAAPSEAVKFALHLQHAMRRAREREPLLPRVRIGIHQGQVVLERREDDGKPLDIYGLQVSTAARIMDLGRADQILCSRAVFDDARAILRQCDFVGLAPPAWRNHGPYRFKGVEDAHEVCEVGEEGQAPLSAPPAAAKGWPAGGAPEEPGWRPAAGDRVPETNWILDAKLGEGEFGEVWRAYNASDKSHQVFKFCFKRDRVPALKREARLLKRLRKYSHPSIVEVFDVTEGERPPHYLEMEYVEGPSLEEWLSARPPLADRLEIIAQIADALDTVHAAGIYHRDIKPANILLAYREDRSIRAKLTDFGLGATEDPELLKSIYASRVTGLAGTWDYLAPELREGKSATARTDIYSLGLTLYQVVAGDLRRPLTADWELNVPSEILRDDIRRCVAQSPLDRWSRAAELATALRSHDQRLKARQLEREREEHRRKMRGLRRVTAAVAAIAIVTFVLGGLALVERNEAARQRDRALNQKKLALQAIDKLTRDVPAKLRDVPGTIPILRGILEENIGMLDRILDLEPDTPQARREKAVNHVSIGDRWMLLGDTGRARAAYEAGLEIAEKLAAGSPDFDRDLSIAYDRLGLVRTATGDTAGALAMFEKAMEITHRWAAGSRAGSADARRDLWFGLDRLGGAYLKVGRTEDALAAHEEGLRITKELAAEFPASAQAQRDLSLAYERVSDVCLLLGRTKEALAASEAGMELGKRRVEIEPKGIEARRDLSVGYDKLGVLYLKLGKIDQALAACEEAARISHELAAEDPDNVQLRRDVAVGYDRLGDAYHEASRTAEALAAYEKGLAIGAELAAKDPGNASAQNDCAAGFSKLGNMYLAAARLEDALAAYEKALAILAKLVAIDPSNAEYRRNLSVFHNKVGATQLRAGLAAEALRSFERGLELARELAAADPKNVQAQRDLGVSFLKLMEACEREKEFGKWREFAAKAIEQFSIVPALAPDDPRAKDDLIEILFGAAVGVRGLPEARPEDYREARSRAERLVELSGGAAHAHLEILAFTEAMTGDIERAIATLERAIGLLPPEPKTEEEKAARARYLETLADYRARAKKATGEGGR